MFDGVGGVMSAGLTPILPLIAVTPVLSHPATAKTTISDTIINANVPEVLLSLLECRYADPYFFGGKEFRCLSG